MPLRACLDVCHPLRYLILLVRLLNYLSTRGLHWMRPVHLLSSLPSLTARSPHACVQHGTNDGLGRILAGHCDIQRMLCNMATMT